MQYDAFLSYSHAKDKLIAAALQSAVQRLGKPWYGRRTVRVFRDDTSLSATPELWPSIEYALARSRYFILLASADAASSRWVADEVEYWIKNKGSDTLLVALTDGELVWDTSCSDFRRPVGVPLPPALERAFRSEPKWIDLRAFRSSANPRDARFIEAAADFAATIRAIPKEDLLSEEVRQQRRSVALAWSAAASLLVFAGLASWQWYEAIAQRRVADQSRKVAVDERDRALLVESRLLTDKSRQQLRDGDAVSAILLALEALPDPGGTDARANRPYLKEAQRALYEAFEQQREIAVSRGLVGKLLGMGSTSGKLCIYSTDSRHTGGNRLYSVCNPIGPEPTAMTLGKGSNRIVAINGDATVVATVSPENAVELWETATGKRLDGYAMDSEVTSVRINKDARYMLIRHKLYPLRYDEPSVAVSLVDLRSLKLTRLPNNLVLDLATMNFSEEGDAYAIVQERSLVVCHLPTNCDGQPTALAPLSEDQRPHEVHFSSKTGALVILSAYLPSLDTASRLEPGEHFLTERGAGESDKLDHSVVLFRRKSKAPIESINPRSNSTDDDIDSVTMSRNLGELHVAFRKGILKTIRLNETKDDTSRVLRGHLGSISHVIYYEDQHRYVTFGKDGTIRHWDATPAFSWDTELHIGDLELNPDNDPDFHIRTDILAEMLRIKKEQFQSAVESLLEKPDLPRISRAQTEAPRCLHPDQRRLFGLDPEPPAWCVELKKWPYDSADWRTRLSATDANKR